MTSQPYPAIAHWLLMIWGSPCHIGSAHNSQGYCFFITGDDLLLGLHHIYVSPVGSPVWIEFPGCDVLNKFASFIGVMFTLLTIVIPFSLVIIRSLFSHVDLTHRAQSQFINLQRYKVVIVTKYQQTKWWFMPHQIRPTSLLHLQSLGSLQRC